MSVLPGLGVSRGCVFLLANLIRVVTGTSVVSDVRLGVDEERRRPSPAALGVLVQRVTNLLRGQASTTLAVNLFLTLLRVPSILIGSSSTC